MEIKARPIEGYPILEYDPNPRAVLEPGHESPELRLPMKAAFPFVGDCVSDYALEHDLPALGFCETITKRYYVYKVTEDVCLCEAPMGAPVAACVMDWLIAHGVRHIVAAGSCGALVDLPENAFVLPARALRDEGTSYHYLPPSRWVDLDRTMQQRIARSLDAAGFKHVELDTWTTDAIGRETVGQIERYRAEGCGVVEMECAALCAVARFRNAQFGQFFFTADSLADAEAYDARDWGRASLLPALKLCLRALGVEA